MAIIGLNGEQVSRIDEYRNSEKKEIKPLRGFGESATLVAVGQSGLTNTIHATGTEQADGENNTGLVFRLTQAAELLLRDVLPKDLPEDADAGQVRASLDLDRALADPDNSVRHSLVTIACVAQLLMARLDD